MPTINSKLYGKSGNTYVPLNPETDASQVYMADAEGGDSTVSAEIIALRQTVSAIISEGVAFKGVVDSTHLLPTTDYKKGWQYVVKEAGTYVGKVCEVGDMVLCIADYVSATASDADWVVMQVNIVGAVSGPATSVAQHVAVFDGTSGKTIADSGFTIAKSVPADAKFTDHEYTAATDAADGLLSASLHVKLGGIETGAQKNQNALASVKVGSTTIESDNAQDTLELVEGTGISLGVDAANKKVTISTTGTTPTGNHIVLQADVAAGSPVTVPSHSIGTIKSLFYNGLFCTVAAGHFTDASATTLEFSFDLETGDEIDVEI